MQQRIDRRVVTIGTGHAALMRHADGRWTLDISTDRVTIFVHLSDDDLEQLEHLLSEAPHLVAAQ